MTSIWTDDQFVRSIITTPVADPGFIRHGRQPQIWEAMSTYYLTILFRKQHENEKRTIGRRGCMTPAPTPLNLESSYRVVFQVHVISNCRI